VEKEGIDCRVDDDVEETECHELDEELDFEQMYGGEFEKLAFNLCCFYIGNYIISNHLYFSFFSLSSSLSDASTIYSIALCDDVR
jgi:hypothetical protein